MFSLPYPLSEERNPRNELIIPFCPYLFFRILFILDDIKVQKAYYNLYIKNLGCIAPPCNGEGSRVFFYVFHPPFFSLFICFFFYFIF